MTNLTATSYLVPPNQSFVNFVKQELKDAGLAVNVKRLPKSIRLVLPNWTEEKDAQLHKAVKNMCMGLVDVTGETFTAHNWKLARSLSGGRASWFVYVRIDE